MEDLGVSWADPGDYWKGRSVLVTGANGFIGSRVAEALAGHGARVVALVRDWKPTGGIRLFGLESRLVVVFGSVTDPTVADRIMRQYGIQNCFHLAAQALVGAARSSPIETFDSNVRGTWVILDACRRAQVETIVVASSDKAYGRASQLPYVESQPLLASHPYDASKACVEVIARSFRDTYDLPLAVTRCANVYGGGDLNLTRLIPDVILSALLGRAPVLRSDGNFVRDFLYVADAVDAYLRLGQSIGRPGIAGEAFNFGTGRPNRVRDVVQRILQLVGRPDLEPVIQNRVKPGEEIAAQYADSGKASRLLGWHATTDLETGLRQTIDWYRGAIDGTVADGRLAEAVAVAPR
jgi:CDP-glucose 4,6-dehydratase